MVPIDLREKVKNLAKPDQDVSLEEQKTAANQRLIIL